MIQRTGSMICPNCRKLINVDDERCPYCNTYRPGLWGIGPALRNVFGVHADVVSMLVIACVGLYAISLVVDLQNVRSQGMMRFLSPSSKALYALGMTGGAAWYSGFWWTLLTATYLHGGLLHIAFNVMWIRSLGPECIENFGKARFFSIFTLSGVGGFLFSNVVGGAPTIGASAAIFGLLGALVAWGRRRGGVAGQAISSQMWMYAGVLFVIGFVMPGVNNLAHFGGFVSGFLLGWFQDTRNEGRWVQILAIALLVMTPLAFAISIYHGLSILALPN